MSNVERAAKAWTPAHRRAVQLISLETYASVLSRFKLKTLPTMTLQNKVLPDSRIVALANYRGMLMGNRGRLHDDQRQSARQTCAVKRWILCVTEFKGRRRTPMTPGQYTELFFLDDATGLAAGHRPCFECRRADAQRFKAARIWDRTMNFMAV